ncbi:copper homeostasis protein CutC [Aureitalea marina]|uniref:PF03932 family protein CutC n=1 Tax=Aureitalea marina TaxID=930804 RepID=A0A2S7KRV3_9FLAO|nr:copper homeostasis protein CutC [Aureitalea marina]PQB05346.1 hypothetical protein BST85_10955 [Aureitalea marina]
MDVTRVEICANGLESALRAQKGGADRIELCRALELNGLTPDPRTIRAAVRQLKIPIHVLIRPRAGNFCYSDNEIRIIIRQIEVARDLGCQGIVCGALTTDRKIDLLATERFIKAAGNLPFTFHRAFDSIPDQYSALEQLIDLGVGRVLTSGGKSTALEGITHLIKLQDQAKDRIEIMPGSGINPNNVNQFLEKGFSSIHSSASRTNQGKSKGSPKTQLTEVKEIIRQVRMFGPILNKG